MIDQFDDFLKSEAQAFEDSAKVAKEKGMEKYEIYCEGVASAYNFARAWIHIHILQDRIEPGEVLTMLIVNKLQKEGLPEKLRENISA